MVGASTNNANTAILHDDSTVKNMYRIREEHAKLQKKDYSHVFRPKSRFDFIRLSCIIVGAEFSYAAETAFVSPILLQIGIQHEHMTLVWGLSPLLGFFLAPLIGSISDRCRLSLGRRRPIIILLAIGILMGLLLIPFGKNLGIILGDTGITTLEQNTNMTTINRDDVGGPINVIVDYKIAALLTIIGTVILDLNANINQGPSRAYLLDVCVPSDHDSALSTYTIVAGLGATFGYIIGAIDWSQTKFGEMLGGNIPTVFMLVSVIFVICVLITVTSFREVPLPLIETDKLMRPLTATDIEKEIAKTAISNEDETDVLYKNQIDTSNAISNQSNLLSSDPNEIEVFETMSFGKYLKSVIVMPKSMRILCLTNLFTWMSHLCYTLYFTDFVGQAVFGGSPSASAGKEKNQIYEDGIQFGCWGMAIYAISCSIYSMSVEKLIKWFTVKWVYIGGLLTYAIGMLFLAIWPTKGGVLGLSITSGILYSTLFIFPYILIAQYHAKQCFKVKDGVKIRLKQSRGLGTDIAVVSSMVFVGQIIVSMTMGSLITWMNSTCAVIYSASAYSLLAAISALFVLYLD